MNTTIIKQIKLWQKISRGVYANLKEILSLLIVSSIFTAIAGLSVVCFSFLLFTIEPIPEIIFAVFLITFSIYNLNKLTDQKENGVNIPERANYIKGKKNLIISLSLISYLFAILFGVFKDWMTFPVIIFPMVIGIAYGSKIYNGYRLKDTVVMKNLFVSSSWGIIATFLPAVFFHEPLLIFLVFYFFFVKIFINTVLFDIRDVKGDIGSGVKTIPATLGINGTKKLLLILNSLLIPWLAVSIYLELFTKYIPILIFCIAYGYWYIMHFCKERSGKFSYDLVIDGEWILLIFLCFIIRSIHF